MAITYTPFEELFAPEYQLTYISTDGHIDVGPNTYSVFHYYTMTERQVIFQVCEKYLPWEETQEQEQWERTQYMYQFVIKSPPPFPYSEYPLSKDIIMTTIIDTTSAQYQQYLNGFVGLRTLMVPRFKLFAKLPRDKQKLWLQKDPLFRKILKTGLVVAEWAEQFRSEVQND